jgi:hypothetical protein
MRRLLLLGLRARDVSSQRDGSKIFLQIHPLNTLRASTLNITVHALITDIDDFVNTKFFETTDTKVDGRKAFIRCLYRFIENRYL